MEEINHPQSESFLTQLRKQIIRCFSIGELQIICFDLGIDYEDLVGSKFTKTEFAISLIDYLLRQERLQELIVIFREKRPNAVWLEDKTTNLDEVETVENQTHAQSISKINYLQNYGETKAVFNTVNELRVSIEIINNKKIDWENLCYLWQKTFGGNLSKITEDKELLTFQWKEPNVEKLIKEAEDGKLDEQIKSLGGNVITEISNSYSECLYQFVPIIDFTSDIPIKAVDKTTMLKASTNIDVLFLTVTEEERDAVLARMKPLPGQTAIIEGAITETTYRFGQFGNYRCAHVESTMGAQGRHGATLKSKIALDELKPKAFLILGIAFGVDRKKQRLGDVIVAETVQPYALERVGKYKVISRGTEMQCGIDLSERFRTRRRGWKVKCGKRDVKVFQGQMLSGPKLIDNKEFRDDLIAKYPNAKGGEMEGEGAYAAAEQARVQTILVKSICDWADGHKNDNAHSFAASTAISLVEHILNQPDVLAILGVNDINNKGVINLENQENLDDKKQSNRNAILGKYISTQSLNPPQYFTGREKVLNDIGNALKIYRKASLCGILGIGKTSAVLKYAETNDEIYQNIIFIRADRLGFQTNFDKTCESLNVNLGQEDNEESKALKFCRKIEEISEVLPKGKYLLLVFDNVDEVQRLQKFLPNHKNVHILLASNFEEIHDLGTAVDISDLSEDEAMILLYRIASSTNAKNLEHLTDEEREIIKEIVSLFGFHPLAVYIAGNYINKNRKTFTKYLERLRNSQGKILKDERGVTAYQYQNIYSAFEIAFNAICNVNDKSSKEQIQVSIAHECMKIASVLSPENIPEEVIWETVSSINWDWQLYLTDEDNRDRVYQKLSQYKLFERDGKANTFTIHRLVRLFFEDKLKDERLSIEEPLAKILEKYFQPFDFTNKPEVERYLTHVGMFLEYLEQNKIQNTNKLKLENESIAKLCNNYAIYYENFGNLTLSEKYKLIFYHICKNTKEIDLELLGSSLNNLAFLYYLQSRYDEAEPLFKEAIKIREEVLGINHPETAKSYNNLGLLYFVQGKYNDAEYLYKKALDIREEIFKTDHLDKAISYNNLGLLLHKKEEYEAAEILFEKTIGMKERLLGEDHPSTAISYNNLANLYLSQKRYEKAEDLYKKALNIRTTILGKEHPYTITSNNDLAKLYMVQEKNEIALPMLEKSFQMAFNVLGEKHHTTQTIKETLLECKENIKNKKYE